MFTAFEKHYCDKSRHGYAPLYSELLLKAPATLLEVGVLRGASIRAWLEELPDTRIYAIDTFERIPESDVPVLRDDRVRCWRGRAEQFELPHGWPESFDIIIDDGCHLPLVQAATFARLHQFTKTYVIEDCKTYHPDWPKLLKALEVFDVTHHDMRDGHRKDSYCLEVRK